MRGERHIFEGNIVVAGLPERRSGSKVLFLASCGRKVRVEEEGPPKKQHKSDRSTRKTFERKKGVRSARHTNEKERWERKVPLPSR